MLQSFIDDSGWDGKSPVFVLAGYVAKVEQWTTFSEEWQVILDRCDPSPLKALKTKDLYRNRVPNTSLHGWTDVQRDELMKALIRVIGKHALHGIISVVPIEPYLRIFHGKFNLRALDRPYFLSFFGVMAALANLTKRLKLDDRIEFIFDTQDNESKPLLMAEYEKFMAVAPPDLRLLSNGPPSFEKDEEQRPLQAADMLAWHARRYYYDLYNGKDPTKEQSNVFFAHLFYPQHDILDIWDEARLEGAAAALLKRKNVGTGRPIPMTLICDPLNPSGWRA